MKIFQIASFLHFSPIVSKVEMCIERRKTTRNIEWIEFWVIFMFIFKDLKLGDFSMLALNSITTYCVSNNNYIYYIFLIIALSLSLGLSLSRYILFSRNVVLNHCKEYYRLMCDFYRIILFLFVCLLNWICSIFDKRKTKSDTEFKFRE